MPLLRDVAQRLVDRLDHRRPEVHRPEHAAEQARPAGALRLVGAGDVDDRVEVGPERLHAQVARLLERGQFGRRVLVDPRLEGHDGRPPVLRRALGGALHLGRHVLAQAGEVGLERRDPGLEGLTQAVLRALQPVRQVRHEDGERLLLGVGLPRLPCRLDDAAGLQPGRGVTGAAALVHQPVELLLEQADPTRAAQHLADAVAVRTVGVQRVVQVLRVGEDDGDVGVLGQAPLHLLRHDVPVVVLRVRLVDHQQAAAGEAELDQHLVRSRDEGTAAHLDAHDDGDEVGVAAQRGVGGQVMLLKAGEPAGRVPEQDVAPRVPLHLGGLGLGVGGDRAVAGQDPQQRGLADVVRADEGDAQRSRVLRCGQLGQQVHGPRVGEDVPQPREGLGQGRHAPASCRRGRPPPVTLTSSEGSSGCRVLRSASSSTRAAACTTCSLAFGTRSVRSVTTSPSP